MTISALLPVAVVATFTVGSFLHYRLTRLAQPLRLELAEKGERLLASAELPNEVRSQVSFMLETAYGMGLLLGVAVFLFPFISCGVLMFRRDILARALRDFSALSAEQRALLYDVMRLHDRVTTANHPILQIILELEVLLLLPLALIFYALSKQPLPGKLDRAVVFNVLEMSESKILGRRSYAH